MGFWKYESTTAAYPSRQLPVGPKPFFTGVGSLEGWVGASRACGWVGGLVKDPTPLFSFIFPMLVDFLLLLLLLFCCKLHAKYFGTAVEKNEIPKNCGSMK